MRRNATAALYDRRAWRRRAKAHLKSEPLCRMCWAEGNKVVAAEICDHIIPHRGDLQLFWFGELQSLCVRHHNATKQQIEVLGFRKDIGEDGFPIDKENHPFCKSK